MKSLLIVEDNDLMRRMIRTVVADLAADIYECRDGVEALPTYASHCLSANDWVLMDVALPQMDGITATRQLKTSFPEAKVCIVTNYDDADLRARAQRAGAVAYVLKDDLFAVRQVIAQV